MHGFNKLLAMAEKKNVTPLDMQVEEFETYEEQFRKALDGLKNTVKEEIHTKIVQNDRARQKRGFNPRSRTGKVVGKKCVKGKGKKVIKQRSQ
jgi:macrodomain Ter protein organizer (MatP/YcbG family)